LPSAVEETSYQYMKHNPLTVWNKIKPFNDEIVDVEVLREKKLTSVYRLKTAGLRSPDIIAKRVVKENILREKYAYEVILPFIPILTPDYFGYIEDPKKRYAWIFIEDIKGEKYSHHSKEHIALGGEWLGFLHVYTSEFDQKVKVCDRRLHYWEELVHKAIEVLSVNLSNSVLTKEDVALIKIIIDYCKIIKRNWHRFEDFYDKLPQVFSHGDFHSANIRLETDQQNETRLCVFDWEESGWGPPALDVVKFLNYGSNTDISAYCRVTQKHWPIFNERTIQRLGYIGDIFISISSIVSVN